MTRLTDEDRREVARRARDGEPYASIAVDYSVSTSYVSKLLRKYHKPAVRERRPPRKTRSLIPAWRWEADKLLPDNAAAYRIWWASNYPGVEYGRCLCGCGRSTPTARQSNRAQMTFAGEPKRYINGHTARKYWPVYDEVDTGYESPCWIVGEESAALSHGSPAVGHSGKHLHRILYEEQHGPIPEGYKAVRQCGQMRCINPAHVLVARGKSGHGRRLSSEQKDRLRAMRVDHTYEELAEMWGISAGTAHNIVNKQASRG